MIKGAVLSLFLVALMLVSQTSVYMQDTVPPATQRANAQATLQVLQSQISDVQATLTALDAGTEPAGSDDEWNLLEGIGVSLRAPGSWESVDEDMEAVIAGLSDLESSTVDLTALSQLAEMVGDVFVLVAVNYDYSTFDFMTNVNMVAADLGRSYPLSMVFDANVEQLNQQFPSVEADIINLNGEEVGRTYLQYDLEGIELRQVQVYFVRGTWIYVLTFTTSAELFPELEDEFFAIAETFEVVD